MIGSHHLHALFTELLSWNHAPFIGCESKTGFTQNYDGGFQVRITEKRLGRRFSGDFMQTRFFGQSQNDFRFSTGPVIFFYRRK